jgi:hypothetical protein
VEDERVLEDVVVVVIVVVVVLVEVVVELEVVVGVVVVTQGWQFCHCVEVGASLYSGPKQLKLLHGKPLLTKDDSTVLWSSLTMPQKIVEPRNMPSQTSSAPSRI